MVAINYLFYLKTVAENDLFYFFRFMIDDHNVPSLADMLRFAENVRAWLEQDPVSIP